MEGGIEPRQPLEAVLCSGLVRQNVRTRIQAAPHVPTRHGTSGYGLRIRMVIAPMLFFTDLDSQTSTS